ncbi:MAG: hypothetical protein AAF950_05180 [Pseudomonadota bacterium]
MVIKRRNFNTVIAGYGRILAGASAALLCITTSCANNVSIPAEIGMSYGRYIETCDFQSAELNYLNDDVSVGECVGKPEEYVLFQAGNIVQILDEPGFTSFVVTNYCAPEDANCANRKAEAIGDITELKRQGLATKTTFRESPFAVGATNLAKKAYAVTPIPEKPEVQPSAFPLTGGQPKEFCELVGQSQPDPTLITCHYNCVVTGVLNENIKGYAQCVPFRSSR